MTGKIFVVSLLLALTGAFALAQDRAAQPVKLTGYLVDNMCVNAEGEGDGLEETAKGHPTACSLMPGCSATGYSLVVDKKRYKLDDAGNKAAHAVLKASKATKGLRVEVEGTLDGNNLRATKVSEVKAAD
ncbi:MAG TPA: hypothetical protein VEY11_18250 [Pyrinomonadaceae bacterium]|nr:hypothetical protein [Pyrinomonadaceae bacterium]